MSAVNQQVAAAVAIYISVVESRNLAPERERAQAASVVPFY